MSNNSFNYQDATITRAIIKSNEGRIVDVSACVECSYVESIYDDTIIVNYTISNSAGTIEGKTLLEGLPLVGKL